MTESFLTEQIVRTTLTQNQMVEEASQVRPWIRLFARMIDGFLFSSFLAFSFSYIFPTSEMQYHILLWMMLPLFLWIPIEALLLSAYGTTLGKWLFKIRVQDSDGSLLSFRSSLKRSIHVWERGLAFGFYYAEWVALYFSYFYLQEKGTTPWDHAGNFLVIHERIGWKRGILISIFVIVLIIFTENASDIVQNDITRTGLILLIGLPFIISGPILIGLWANAQDKTQK